MELAGSTYFIYFCCLDSNIYYGKDVICGYWLAVWTCAFGDQLLHTWNGPASEAANSLHTATNSRSTDGNRSDLPLLDQIREAIPSDF